jgi:hypothetical protein
MPEDRRAEGEMSDGRLLVRARAVQRVWEHAPAAVHEAQRWHHQAAAEDHRRAALAAAVGDQATAEAATAAGDARDAAAARLDDVAVVRAEWLVHHAETIAAGEAALEELTRRGVDIDARNAAGVTAEEWLADHDRAVAIDDAHRHVTETDVLADDVPAAGPGPVADATVDLPPAPHREVTPSATAAALDAAAAHAVLVQDRLADETSQDATGPALDAGDVHAVVRTLGPRRPVPSPREPAAGGQES